MSRVAEGWERAVEGRERVAEVAGGVGGCGERVVEVVGCVFEVAESVGEGRERVVDVGEDVGEGGESVGEVGESVVESRERVVDVGEDVGEGGGGSPRRWGRSSSTSAKVPLDVTDGARGVGEGAGVGRRGRLA